jgi:hypothetical protein
MISTSRLDEWTRGLDPPTAARALLVLGLQPPRASQPARPAAAVPPIRFWSLTERGLTRRLRTPAAELAETVEPAECRVAVAGDVVAIEVARRLRTSPFVAAAFAAVGRGPGALRHRPWSWPLRIGLLGFTRAEAESMTGVVIAAGHLPERLVDVRRIEDEPAAVDVLVTRQPLASATPAVIAAKPLANAVLVLGEPSERWPVVDGMLATIRAATGAIASTLVPPGSLDALGIVLREMSHALPIDVAATRAWHGEELLWAEPDRLDHSLVAEIAVRRAREFRAAERVIPTPLPPQAPAAAEALDAMAAGAFAGETHEASGIAEASAALQDALEPVPDERWLQACVNADAEGAPRNAFVHGENTVLVFVGPAEEDALLAATPFDERKLPWKEEDADAFRLTVVLAPLVPRGEPQSEQIELPRFGRSQIARFHLEVPPGTETLSARVLLLFRSRILQTALLTGRVGSVAQLADLLALVPGFAALDERRAFDAALLANHDASGLRALIEHASPRTKVSDGGAIQATVERLAGVLYRAADLKPTSRGLAAKRARDILVELAVHGRELNDRLSTLAEARRIQVVTARGEWFLPIELAYDREAPNDGAAVCENFLRDLSSCGPACPPSLDVVCPGAFWGLSRTIERHRFDPELEEEIGAQIVLVGQPRAKRRTLSLERALLGASARVRPPDLAVALAALGVPASTAASWEDWETALAGADTQLLVLLPHTDYAGPSLEISNSKLVRGRIEKRHVTGDRDVEPVVVLFGCRTAGNRGDPGGFASRFMMKDAAIVFHSLADLKAGHAAQMAEQLVTLLRSQRDHTAVSELLTLFRRRAVHGGLLAALAIAAYGDADWRL